jgi:hypothetical protein
MKHVFNLLFQLRNIKKEKLKIRFRDLIFILKYYNRYKIYRFIKFKEFYYYVIEDCLKNIHTFEIGCKTIHKELLEKIINE